MRGFHGELAVNQTPLIVAAEGVGLRLLPNDAVARSEEFECRPDASAFRPAFSPLDSLQPHPPVILPAMVAIVFREHFLLPEVEAIHISVSEIERPLVRLERGRPRICGTHVIANWKSPGNDCSVGRAQRHQVGLGGFRSDEVCRKWLAGDADVNRVVLPFDRYFRTAETARNHQQTNSAPGTARKHLTNVARGPAQRGGTRREYAN